MGNDCCDLLCLDLPLAERLRRERLTQVDAERVATAAHALADPTRVGLAGSLRAGGELCVCDLSWITERSQSLVSHHLRRLRAAGLVRSRRDGKMVLYSLTPAGLALLDALAGPAVEPAGVVPEVAGAGHE